jgi:hypothetical protein
MRKISNLFYGVDIGHFFFFMIGLFFVFCICNFFFFFCDVDIFKFFNEPLKKISKLHLPIHTTFDVILHSL